MDKVTSYVSLSLSERIKTQEERIASFSNTIKISEEALNSECEELQEKECKERYIIDKARQEQTINNTSGDFYDVCRTLTLGKKVDQSGTNTLDFFYPKNLKEAGGLKELSDKDAYYRLSFDKNFQDGLVENNTYKIQAKITLNVTTTRNNKKEHKLTFQYIDSIDIIRSSTQDKFNALKKSRIELRKKNWERAVTQAEKKEQEQEISIIKIDLEKITNRESKNIELSYKIAPVLKKIENLQKGYCALNIKPNSLFPSSMSFIQNPNYQGVHKLYKEIQTLSGLDEQLFVGLEKAESIGILNISLIYERWCLLQIIKVLIDKFKFLPEKNWKDNLLNQVINIDPSKVRDVKISFENKDTCRKIDLGYEQELPTDSGRNAPRRPDFVIDLDSYSNPNNLISKRIVLDAKFYENITEMGGISKVIDELYNFKNYSGSGKNSVFILHPSPEAVPEIKTPQQWAKNSFLGESKIFDWDDDLPNHDYGAILLSPVRNKGDYLESLQMCIGLSLQYGVENNSLSEGEFNGWVKSQLNISNNNGINPLPKGKVFCLICGGSNLCMTVKQTKYKFGLKWTQACNDCHHETLYNYCSNCKSRLIKHGIYWTYHATQSLQPFNIKCPKCGTIASQ